MTQFDPHYDLDANEFYWVKREKHSCWEPALYHVNYGSGDGGDMDIGWEYLGYPDDGEQPWPHAVGPKIEKPGWMEL